MWAEREQALRPLAPRGTAAASRGRSRSRTASRTEPGCTGRTRRSTGRPRAPARPTAATESGRQAARRSRQRPPPSGERLWLEQQRVERHRERERRPGQEGGAGQEPDEPGTLPSRRARSGSANVRIVAMRWPVCQTPPRVVTHRIWVENPNRTVNQNRSASRATPIAAEQPPAHADAGRGEDRVDARFHLVRGDRPEDRDDRHERDRRERRERDVETVTDRDDVVRPESDIDRGSAVQERIREVEEVAASGVELAVRQPVDQRRSRDDGEADQKRRRRATAHAATGTARDRSTRRPWISAPRVRPTGSR